MILSVFAVFLLFFTVNFLPKKVKHTHLLHDIINKISNLQIISHHSDLDSSDVLTYF